MTQQISSTTTRPFHPAESSFLGKVATVATSLLALSSVLSGGVAARVSPAGVGRLRENSKQLSAFLFGQTAVEHGVARRLLQKGQCHIGRDEYACHQWYLSNDTYALSFGDALVEIASTSVDKAKLPQNRTCLPESDFCEPRFNIVPIAIVSSGSEPLPHEDLPLFNNTQSETVVPPDSEGSQRSSDAVSVLFAKPAYKEIDPLIPETGLTGMTLFSEPEFPLLDKTTLAFQQHTLLQALTSSAPVYLVLDSFPGDCPEPIVEVVNRKIEEGAVFVAAADSGCLAKLENVITVAATDKEGRLVPGSSNGGDVTIHSPGYEFPVVAPNNTYSTATGQHVAAATVAAAVEQLMFLYANSEFNETVFATKKDLGDKVRELVVETATVGPDSKGVFNNYRFIREFLNFIQAKRDPESKEWFKQCFSDLGKGECSDIPEAGPLSPQLPPPFDAYESVQKNPPSNQPAPSSTRSHHNHLGAILGGSFAGLALIGGAAFFIRKQLLQTQNSQVGVEPALREWAIELFQRPTGADKS